MTKLEILKDRLQNAEANVAKREATIERHKAQLEKKIAKIAKVDWIDTDKLEDYKYNMEARARYEKETGSDLYWDICEVSSKQQDIKDSYKKLDELKAIVENWKEKVVKAELHEAVWSNEIPEAFKSYKDYLVQQWDEFDKKRRSRLREEYKTLGYKEFDKKYVGCLQSVLSLKNATDEEIHKENERSANSLIFDLYGRIYKYTGKVVSWDYLTISQGHINGYVEGENSNVKVESILAGGYNIQRLHVRVVVHPYDKPVSSDKKDKKEYKDMTMEELEQLGKDLKVGYKKCDNEAINRMRLVVAIKKATN